MLICAALVCATTAHRASAGQISITTTDVIQDIIDSPTTVNGDVLIVSQGVYNQRIDFMGKAITVRSADGPATTIFDGTGLTGAMITCQSGETRNCVLEGFTIRNAQGPAGGGMFIAGSNPTVIDCVFIQNNSSSGGGAASLQSASQPLFIDCDYYFNTGTIGGAISATSISVIECRDCDFVENSAPRGGACAASAESDVILDDCRFAMNGAANAGGAVFVQTKSDLFVRGGQFLNNSCNTEGGALHLVTESNAILANVKFIGNKAAEGGAVYVEDSSLVVTNCVFVKNVATTLGGGIHAFFATDCRVSSTSMTLNSSGVSGGGIFDTGSDTLVSNSILFKNNVGAQTGSEAQIFSLASQPVVNFSCIQGGWTGLGGAGIISVDPLFTNPAANNLHLIPASPCVDAGSAALREPDTLDLDEDNDITELTPVDLDFAPRIVMAALDIGAFEVSSVSRACIGDCAPSNPDGTFGNGAVNIDDILMTVNGFGDCPMPPIACPCDSSPINANGTVGNGSVNIDDLFSVINAFGICP
jgi:predicted outer membrane repeat protein